MKRLALILLSLLPSCATDSANLLIPDSLVIGSGFTRDWEHRTNTVSLFWQIPPLPESPPDYLLPIVP